MSSPILRVISLYDLNYAADVLTTIADHPQAWDCITSHMPGKTLGAWINEKQGQVEMELNALVTEARVRLPVDDDECYERDQVVIRAQRHLVGDNAQVNLRVQGMDAR